MTLASLIDSVNQWVSLLSDWTGVISAAISVVAIIYSVLKKKSQRSDYEDAQDEILQKLNALRKDVIDSENFTKTTVSDIRTEIYKAEHHFNRLLSAEDKKRLHNARKSLSFDIQAIDTNTLCDTFDYFIAKIRKKS